MCDPHLRLAHLLRDRAGADAILIDESARPWSSVTFNGARHHLAFAVRDGRVASLTALSCEDLTIPGHLVADLRLTAHEPRDGFRVVECAALTVEAA